MSGRSDYRSDYYQSDYPPPDYDRQTGNGYYEEGTRYRDSQPVEKYTKQSSRSEPGGYSDARGYAQDDRYRRDDDPYERDSRMSRYNNEVAYARKADSRRSSRRRQRSPTPEEEDVDRGRGYEQSRSRSRSGSRSVSGTRLRGAIGTEKKDLAATVIGAIAGGFLAHEASRGKKPVATVGGVILGALAGNAIEHQHLKRNEIRQAREERS